jgi:hypothetical protein
MAIVRRVIPVSGEPAEAEAVTRTRQQDWLGVFDIETGLYFLFASFNKRFKT